MRDGKNQQRLQQLDVSDVLDDSDVNLSPERDVWDTIYKGRVVPHPSCLAKIVEKGGSCYELGWFPAKQHPP